MSSADDLRRRAANLRRVARQVDDCSATSLHRRAGDDTWRGPTSDACYETLLTIRSNLANAATQLRADARRLDQRAGQLDAASMVVPYS